MVKKDGIPGRVWVQINHFWLGLDDLVGLIYTVRQRTRYVQIIRLRTVLKIFEPNDFRDVFEIMQKMNKYNAKIDVIQSDNVYNKGKSITEKSEILHLKEIVKG